MGPKLRKAYHGYFQESNKDEDFFELIPGPFEREFADLPAKQNPKDPKMRGMISLCCCVGVVIRRILKLKGTTLLLKPLLISD